MVWPTGITFALHPILRGSSLTGAIFFLHSMVLGTQGFEPEPKMSILPCSASLMKPPYSKSVKKVFFGLAETSGT